MAFSMRRAQIPVEYGKIRKCTIHPEKYITLSCDTCNDELVCTKCVATVQKSHKFSELEDLAAKKALPLNEFVICSRDQLGNLRAVLNKLKNMKQSSDENLKMVIETIKERKKEMHEQVDQIATSIEEEFKTKVQENVSAIESREEFVTSLAGEITKAVGDCQAVLDSESVWDVLDFKPAELSFDDKCNSELAQLPDALRYSLNILDEENSTLKHVFGELKEELVSRSGNDSDIQPPPLPPRPKNVATENEFRLPATAEKINLPFGGISNICVVNEDEAWISYINVSGRSQQSSNTLHHIRRNGDIIATIDVNFSVLCLLLLANNSLIASCEDRTLKSITLDGEISDLFKCKGMPNGFCDSNNDSIVVCLYDTGRVVKYSKNGKELKSLASGVIKPFKISKNKRNGEMVITDHSKKQNQGFLLVVDANLKPLRTINESLIVGTPLECKGRFCPNQACFDKKGNVVFVMINHENGFVVNVTDKVIQNFVCLGSNSTLAVTASREIWIGCDNGDIIIVKDL